MKTAKSLKHLMVTSHMLLSYFKKMYLLNQIDIDVKKKKMDK